MLRDGRFFTFIAGAEGSGTTLLLRLLAAGERAVSLGGNHVKLPDEPEAQTLGKEFDAENRDLWDRKLSFAAHNVARIRWHETMRRMLEHPAFGDITAYFFKRSFPFLMPRDRFQPDIWDILDLWPDAHFVTIYRDPRESSYSAFRRGFDNDIRRLAVTCSEQLTWLAAQVRAVGPERFSIISYRRLCENPVAVLCAIAPYCGIGPEDIDAAVSAHPVVPAADRWAQELSPEDGRDLDGFFSAGRAAQWDILIPDGE